jgi:hypothetical protein
MYPSDSYYAKYSPQDSNVHGSIYVRAVPPTSSSHQLRTVYGLCASDMIQSMDLDGYISSRVLARVPGHEWDAHRPYVRAAPGVTYARARSSAPWTYAPSPAPARPRRLPSALARTRTHRHHVYSLIFLQGTHATVPYDTLKQLRYGARYTDRAYYRN